MNDNSIIACHGHVTCVLVVYWLLLFPPALIAVSSPVIISDYRESPHGGCIIIVWHRWNSCSITFMKAYKSYKYSTLWMILGFGAGVNLVVLAEKPS